MKNVLLSCVALAAGSAMAMAQALPEYPEKLDLTLNGENELPGVTVTQEMIPFDGDDYLTITVTGESNANEITLDMATPAGWDGMLVRSDYSADNEDIEPLKAKAPAKDNEDLWMPVEFAMYSGVEWGNSVTFPVDGKEWHGMALLVKGEDAYMVNIDFIFDVNKIGGPDVPGDDPVFPNHLDITLNGESELPGITVRELIDGTTNVLDIQGEIDSDKITVSFATPAGWDGLMIADFWGMGEISTVGTRADDELIPITDILGMGFKEGNTITYDTDGEANDGYIALIKGDMACPTFINYAVTVSKSGTPDIPGDDPVVPDDINVTTFENGLDVWQGVEDDVYTINVSGTVAEDEFSVVLDVPEGWDGFISYPTENVIIDENIFSPRKTRANEIAWIPVEYLLEDGFVKGNRFTFFPNGEVQNVEIYLYKGDQADMANVISLVNDGVIVSDVVMPQVPTTFDVTASSPALVVTQGVPSEENLTEDELEFANMFFADRVITLSGETSRKDMSLTFDLPEPWAGVLPLKVNLTAAEDEETGAKTRAEIELAPLSEFTESMVSMGWFDDSVKGGTELTFPANNERQVYLSYLYLTDDGTMVGGEEFAGDYADINNAFIIVVDVESTTVAVEGIDAVDTNATYYDINGRKVAKPAQGMYVKVADGKATKVIVK